MLSGPCSYPWRSQPIASPPGRQAGGAADDHLFLRAFSRAVGYWPAQGVDGKDTTERKRVARQRTDCIEVRRCGAVVCCLWLGGSRDGEAEGVGWGCWGFLGAQAE